MKKPKIIKPGNYNGIIVNPGWIKLARDIKSMDFFCAQTGGILGWNIQKITKNFSSDRECEFTHCGLLLHGGLGITVEALWKIELKNLFERQENNLVLIARYKEITPELAVKSFHEIKKHIGQSFPINRLLLHLINLAHIFHWNTVVCSELVAKALYYMGARGHHYFGTTPDNIADEIKKELNKERTGPKYDIIFEGKLPWLIYKHCPRCLTVDLTDILAKKCPQCRGNYLDDHGILNRELAKLVKNYNDKKIKYISKMI